MICAFPLSEIPPALSDKAGGAGFAFSRGSSDRSWKARPSGLLQMAGDRGLEKKPHSSKFPPFKKGDKGGFSNGFTLVEVIVTILAAAILGAIFINFMGTAMSLSTRSLENVHGEADAEAAVEKIVADYVEKINLNESSALGDMNTAINTTKTYDSSEKKMTVTASYIDFDGSGNEAADSSKLRTLKVLVNANEHRCTILLTKSRASDSPPVPF